MDTIREIVESLGGFARKRELVARGAKDHHLTDAVRRGQVLRARNGWYSTRPETDAAFRAIRVGGRLTGASALHEAGAWMRSAPPLHVSVPSNAARMRSPRSRRAPLTRERKHGVTMHWDAPELGSRGTRTSVSIPDALVAYVPNTSWEEAIAALDWATATQLIDLTTFREVIARLPKRLRGIADWVDPYCQSYPESLVRTRLRLCGYRLRSQVPVGELESIDLVVEEEIALEVDGKEHHLFRFVKDRRKDLHITLADKHALRLSVDMIYELWPDIEAGIAIALRARGITQGSLGERAAMSSEHPTSRIGRRREPRIADLNRTRARERTRRPADAPRRSRPAMRVERSRREDAMAADP